MGEYKLTLEQQFSIRSFEQQIKDLSREQALQGLSELYRQMLLKDNAYKSLLKERWGIESQITATDTNNPN